jgi:hypothetical protein
VAAKLKLKHSNAAVRVKIVRNVVLLLVFLATFVFHHKKQLPVNLCCFFDPITTVFHLLKQDLGDEFEFIASWLELNAELS